MATVRGGDQGLTFPPAVHTLHQALDVQHFDLGTKLWYGERCYKYAKAGNTLQACGLLAWYNDYGVSGFASVPTATGLGSDQVNATIGSGEGVAADGLVAKDELVGGYITVFQLDAGTSNTDYTFLILGNEAVASGGGTCLVTIDQPLPFACGTGAATEITGNPYSDIRKGSSNGGRAFMGLPQAPATTTLPYFWLQTWGPAWCSPQAAVGNTAYNNLVVARYDGSIQDAHASTAIDGFGGQVIGYVYTRLAGGAETQGTPLIFLTISC